MHDEGGGDGPPRAGRPVVLPRPRKRLGQHFLHDQRVLRRIVDALELSGSETVLEIGPGRGALTDLLAPRAGRLIAIELDRDLAPILRERFTGSPHVEIVEGDVLDMELSALAGGEYVLAGNVPYYITTPILFHALRPPRPLRAVFLVQREVAERMAAPPGSKKFGALSVNVQVLVHAEQLLAVPPRSFRPPPAVDSALVRVTPRATPLVAQDEELAFQRLVQAIFGLRRKQMRRVMRTVRGIEAEEAERLLAGAGIDPDARPESLEPEAFVRLFRAAKGKVETRSDE